MQAAYSSSAGGKLANAVASACILGQPYIRPRSWDWLYSGTSFVIKLARDRDEADLGCRRSGIS